MLHEQSITSLLAMRESIQQVQDAINRALEFQQEQLTQRLLCSHGYTVVACKFIGIAFKMPHQFCINNRVFTHVRFSFSCDCCRGGCCIEFFEEGKIHEMQFWSILCRHLGIQEYDECMRTEAEIVKTLYELILFVDAAPYLEAEK